MYWSTFGVSAWSSLRRELWGVLRWGTFFGVLGLGGFTNSATPCDCVRRAIGWVSDGGWSRGASMGGVVNVLVTH